MSFVMQAIGFIFVSLIVINGLLGGGVVEAIGTFATEEETAQARLDLSCGLGYMMYKPVTDFHGINVPMPSYANVAIASLLALCIILIIRVTTGIAWKFKYSLLMFLASWIMIKVAGAALMAYAGNDCMTWAEEAFASTSGFYEIAAAGGILWGIKTVWGFRK